MGTLDLDFCNWHLWFCFQLHLPLYSDSHGICLAGRRPAKGSLSLAKVFRNSETDLQRIGLHFTARSAKYTPYAASGARFDFKLCAICLSAGVKISNTSLASDVVLGYLHIQNFILDSHYLSSVTAFAPMLCHTDQDIHSTSDSGGGSISCSSKLPQSALEDFVFWSYKKVMSKHVGKHRLSDNIGLTCQVVLGHFWVASWWYFILGWTLDTV